MNFCEKYSDLIQDLLENELDKQRAAQAESHIFACQKCREQYETLRRAEEIYAQYLFETEPPPDSWANFEARLNAENEKTHSEEIIAASWFHRRKTLFGFNFSPAAAAFAALLFACGIGFVLLQDGFEKNGGGYVAETETKNSPASAQSNETDEKPATNSPAQFVTTDNKLKNNDLLAESKSLKAKSNSLSGKKSRAAETAKINQKTSSLNKKEKAASDFRLNEENQLSDLQAQKLEMEIARQMEKVELLLRSFRNARSNETSAGFDVEYEKRQARKLLDKNAMLKSDAEDYGLSYAEELLSRVEPHLLEIANLETNPSTDTVLDIKTRVSSQNIIASLQAYSRNATQ